MPPAETPKRDWWQRRYTFTGTAVGLIFLWLSLGPSLLPRGPLFQGLVSAGAGAIGYALGVFAVWLVRFMLSRPASPAAPRWASPVLVVSGVIGMVLGIYWFHLWQDDVRDLMGVPRLKWFNYPQAGLIAVIVLFLFVEIGQLIGKLIRYLVRQLNRVAPPRVSFVVVVALLLGLSIALLNGVVVRGAMGVLNKTFASVNDEMDPNNPAPTTPLRTGGPGSLVSWNTLGHQGRIFVAGGPTVEQLTRSTAPPRSNRSAPTRARTPPPNPGHGRTGRPRTGTQRRAQRKVIAVATTTGTGWINDAEASALEYMFNGDSAIVTMQYSFLPSWLSFLVDKENARQAGQALFEAVDARVRALPEAQRPRLWCSAKAWARSAARRRS